LRLRHGAPLDAGRKSGAAATAQARLQNFLDNCLSTERQRPFETLAAAMRAIIVERARIEDAAAGEVSRVCRLSQGISSVGPGPLARFGNGTLIRMRADLSA
jgi:hypothetical protein